MGLTNRRARRVGLGSTGEQITAVLTAERSAASGSTFAQNAADELSHQAYAQAMMAGTVPSYITSSVDQAAFTSLSNKIDSGGFASLSPEEQVQFNALRTTGTSDIDAPRVGGASSGVYAWNPLTGEGDAPPNAAAISKVFSARSDPNYRAPSTGSSERAIVLDGGRYKYQDDGSLVSRSELDRLGLRITSSAPPVSVSQLHELAATDPFAQLLPDGGAAAIDPSIGDGTGSVRAAPSSISEFFSSTTKEILVGVAVTAGVALVMASAKRRR